MGTATGEQKRAASANGRQSTENRIQCPGRAEKEVNRQGKGFFWPKKGKMLFLCFFNFKRFILIFHFGGLRPRGRRRCSLDFGPEDDGRGCARGIPSAGIEVLSKIFLTFFKFFMNFNLLSFKFF